MLLLSVSIPSKVYAALWVRFSNQRHPKKNSSCDVWSPGSTTSPNIGTLSIRNLENLTTRPDLFFQNVLNNVNLKLLTVGEATLIMTHQLVRQGQKPHNLEIIQVGLFVYTSSNTRWNLQPSSTSYINIDLFCYRQHIDDQPWIKWFHQISPIGQALAVLGTWWIFAW